MQAKKLISVGIPISLGIILAFIVYIQSMPPLLNRRRKKVKILSIERLSHDTKLFCVSTGSRFAFLGLPVGMHLRIFASNPLSCLTSGLWNGRPDSENGEKEIVRDYTPVTCDEIRGSFNLVVKIYRPGTTNMPDGSQVQWVDGGKMGMYLDQRQVGDFIDVNGPFGIISYLGENHFKIPGAKRKQVSHVGFLAGGSGITPILQVVKAALRDKKDTTSFSLVYGNKTEDDILVRDELEKAASSSSRFVLYYTLDFPPPNWKGRTGFITSRMIEECLPSPSLKPLIFLCGPPIMESSCKSILQEMGYEKGSFMSF